jgi:hypothetical protein
VIIETCRGPNKTFRDAAEIVDNALNPLHAFGDARGDELRRDST